MLASVKSKIKVSKKDVKNFSVLHYFQGSGVTMPHFLRTAVVVLHFISVAICACCPPGGIWSKWTAGKCSDSCGGFGTQNFTRTCTSAKNGCYCRLGFFVKL